MRTVTDVSLSAPGSSPWIPLNYLAKWFGATAFASLDNGVTASYSMQRTYDDPTIVTARSVVVTRSGTTATVTDAAHGLLTGDNITMQGIGDGNMDGSHDITVVDANTYTYTVANSGPTSGGVGAKLNSFRVIPDANMTTKTARADCQLLTPVMAVRLVATAVSGGNVRLRVIQGHGG
jgi:hypothetical protein